MRDIRKVWDGDVTIVITKVFIGVLFSPKRSIEKLIRCVRSIENQIEKPFDFDIKIIVNTNDSSVTREVEYTFKEQNITHEIIETISNGTVGRGVNSVFDIFLERKSEGYSHVIKIDYDDMYYPYAFKLLDSIFKDYQIDHLNLCHLGDNLIRVPHDLSQLQSPLPILEIFPGVALRSPFNYRLQDRQMYQIYAHHIYWNGEYCPGGEITLIESLKAIETMRELEYKCLEIPNIPEDYFYLLQVIIEHQKGNLIFANTDCNEIYCYDMTGAQSATRGEDVNTLDVTKWKEEVQNMLIDPKFETLRNVRRIDLPLVSFPYTLCDEVKKKEFILENFIGE